LPEISYNANGNKAAKTKSCIVLYNFFLFCPIFTPAFSPFYFNFYRKIYLSHMLHMCEKECRKGFSFVLSNKAIRPAIETSSLMTTPICIPIAPVAMQTGPNDTANAAVGRQSGPSDGATEPVGRQSVPVTWATAPNGVSTDSNDVEFGSIVCKPHRMIYKPRRMVYHPPRSIHHPARNAENGTGYHKDRCTTTVITV
jgi:hypothetical protein